MEHTFDSGTPARAAVPHSADSGEVAKLLLRQRKEKTERGEADSCHRLEKLSRQVRMLNLSFDRKNEIWMTGRINAASVTISAGSE